MTETWTPMVKRMKRRANPGRPATGQYASYSHGAQARLRYGYRLTEGGFVIERRTPPPVIEKRYKVGQESEEPGGGRELRASRFMIVANQSPEAFAVQPRSGDGRFGWFNNEAWTQPGQRFSEFFPIDGSSINSDWRVRCRQISG